MKIESITRKQIAVYVEILIVIYGWYAAETCESFSQMFTATAVLLLTTAANYFFIWKKPAVDRVSLREKEIIFLRRSKRRL